MQHATQLKVYYMKDEFHWYWWMVFGSGIFDASNVAVNVG